jgi:hypothetical protein
MAAEEAAIEAAMIADPDAKKSESQKGRGQPPVYKWESLAVKSSELPVEHFIWSQPQPIARAGSDLFSTLWVTIAGALRSIATARRLDGNDPAVEGEHTKRTQRLYTNFFEYLTGAPKSPFKPSLAKMELKPDRWNYILTAPFYHNDDKLDEWAAEAKKMGLALEAKARLETSKTFDKLIQTSLEDGGGWIHRYLKNEQQQSPTICSDLIVRGLPAHTKAAVRNIFEICGEITRVELGKEGKHTAAVHFKHDESRCKALLLNKTVLPDGKLLTVEGLSHRYTNDPMYILEAHAETWGKQWKAGDPEEFQAAAAAVRKLLAQIAAAGQEAEKTSTPLKQYAWPPSVSKRKPPRAPTTGPSQKSPSCRTRSSTRWVSY